MPQRVNSPFLLNDVLSGILDNVIKLYLVITKAF